MARISQDLNPGELKSLPEGGHCDGGGLYLRVTGMGGRSWIIILSGHGVMTPDQHYRFLPYDYDPHHVERTTISDAGAMGSGALYSCVRRQKRTGWVLMVEARWGKYQRDDLPYAKE
jgi:hypothetical protein